ncbi:Zinc finger protein with KRAB and SCAN domains 1 [Pteropus alecto]|uniref:Zinc finger protein with KRAB and SCAN domains 1 n=1 Tax=Pteropus alecto TaxID=9402 RepID=L5K8Z6_PTEAL|nr:Zinc finger protein with KRAB and SCAN domains 1 [Pteropus alecto]
MVKIEDMAVSLILEEWGCQNLARRNLSRDNRQENYGNVFSQENIFAASQHAVCGDSLQEEKKEVFRAAIDKKLTQLCSKGNQGSIPLYWPTTAMAAKIDGKKEREDSESNHFRENYDHPDGKGKRKPRPTKTVVKNKKEREQDPCPFTLGGILLA